MSSQIIKKIGFGYINEQESHSVANSVHYHLSKLKEYESKGFERLDDFDFILFDMEVGKSRGDKRIKRDFDKLDRVYIFNEDAWSLKNAIGEDLFEKKVISIDLSYLKKLEGSCSDASISNMFLAKVFFDIDNDFKSMDNKIVYMYDSPGSLIKDGEKSIRKVKVGDFEDFIKKSFCPYSYPSTFDSIEELYEDALETLTKDVERKNSMIASFNESIEQLKKSIETTKNDYNTLKALYEMK